MSKPRNIKPRDGKRRRTTKTADPVSERSYRHPLFGDIPMIPVMRTDYYGQPYEMLDFDPSYEPPLPKGAVRGNVHAQHFCRMCHVPHYFYVDIPQTCVQCEKPFVFGAAEQKLWYETYQFHFDAHATRCLRCRRQRRSDQALTRQLAVAKEALRARPDDASAHLAVAEAIVRYYQRRKQGKLQEAIAASRKARRLLRDHAAHELAETFFWEGLALRLAGHAAPAQEALSTFLSSAHAGRRQAVLAKEARALVTA